MNAKGAALAIAACGGTAGAASYFGQTEDEFIEACGWPSDEIDEWMQKIDQCRGDSVASALNILTQKARSEARSSTLAASGILKHFREMEALKIRKAHVEGQAETGTTIEEWMAQLVNDVKKPKETTG